MEKTKGITEPKYEAADPAALAAQYLRLYTHHLPAFDDFDDFMDGLQRLVGEDTYLLGTAHLGGTAEGAAQLPDFEKLSGEQTIISVCGETGNQGFIQYAGKQGGGSFGAGDMHLMGAIAGFISLLSARAREYQDQSRASKVLEYLINKLPLGVVCYGSDGALIVQSKLASRLLGSAGGASLSSVVADSSRFENGQEQLHLEVEGRFLFAEGRRLQIEEQMTMTAFVLYDLSNFQQKLTGDLEREAFRSDSRGTPLTLAVLEAASKASPGQLYQFLKASADALQIPKSAIHPLDAFRCACLFSGEVLREVRVRLAKMNLVESTIARLFLAQHASGSGEDAPGEHLMKLATEGMKPVEEALLPSVLVLDSYPAVSEALEVATSEVCQVISVASVNEALRLIESGSCDGLFVGLDDCPAEALAEIQAAAQAAEGTFKLFYLSYKQASLARKDAGLDGTAEIFQKPFLPQKIVECLNRHFN